jgi:hypothetical protein
MKKSVHQNATVCDEIKKEKMFSVKAYMLRQALCRLARSPFPLPTSLPLLDLLKLGVILRPL